MLVCLLEGICDQCACPIAHVGLTDCCFSLLLSSFTCARSGAQDETLPQILCLSVGFLLGLVAGGKLACKGGKDVF